jgi:hypothetical protein
MPKSEGFCADGYAIGVDYAAADSQDNSVIALVKFGQGGEPDELKATLTWEEAKLVARMVAESEGRWI